MSNAAMVYLLRILWGMPATAKGGSGPGTVGQEPLWDLNLVHPSLYVVIVGRVANLRADYQSALPSL